MYRKAKIIYIITLLLQLGFNTSLSADNVKNQEDSVHSTQKFDPGRMILDHVYDSYEWHITNIGEYHITIPLPIILYSENSGWHFFSSSRFHESEDRTYFGFSVAKGGRYDGKILETTATGEFLRPWDFSITKNVLSLFTGVLLIIFLCVSLANMYKKNYAKAPSGIQSWLEPIIIFIRDDVAKTNIGEEKYEKYLPYLLTLFFFVLINNIIGLIPFFPGGANLTGNITVTMTLALFTFVITIFSSNKSYWIEIINTPGVPWWLKYPVPLIPIVEIMSFFTKPFALMIRLFANITAGHVVALGFYSLIFLFGSMNVWMGYGVSIVSISFTLFMGLLELLVVFIQAYVFTLLSALYIRMAIEDHREEH